jgi:hypothetical protein
LKKGNKEILTGTSVPLDTCLLMGDPAGGCGQTAYASAIGPARKEAGIHARLQIDSWNASIWRAPPLRDVMPTIGTA